MSSDFRPVSIQVMDSLGEGRGGLTKAVFDRLELLSREHRVILATVAYQPNVRSLFERMKQRGTIPVDVELRSFHEDSRNIMLAGQKATSSYRSWLSDNSVSLVADGPNIERFYKHGIFLGLIAKDRSGKLVYSDVHSFDRPWELMFRERFWSDGSLAIREYIDNSAAARYRIYYNRDSVPYMSTWVTPGRYECRATYWTENAPRTLTDVRSANAIWLDSLIGEFSHPVIFFDEPRTSFTALAEKNGAKIVATIHTTHRESSETPGAKLWVKHYLNNADNIDLFIVLTETQRQHLLADFNLRDSKVLVIPHGVKRGSTDFMNNDYKPEKFVIVSRLAKEKRVDESIRAFSHVVKNEPSAVLEIYGTGSESESLNKLVQSLSLEKNVKLFGRTDEPLSVMNGACASVITSTFEGFGLTILESMTQGTPVVGYRVLYGPSDLINESNGILVDDLDVIALSEAMLMLMRQPELREKLSSGAYSTSLKYSVESWEDRWWTIAGRNSRGN